VKPSVPLRHWLATCSIAAIAGLEPLPAALAASPPEPAAPTPGLPQLRGSPSILAGNPETAQYYQDYQSAAPTEPNPRPTTPAPGVMTAAPTSLSEPIWVVPTQPAPPAVPPAPVMPPPPARPGAAPPLPASPGNLSVTVTSLQVVGVDVDLQQTVLKTIKTQLGGQTNQIQLNQDIADILETGLFATADYQVTPNPQGIGVVYGVSPMVVRSLQLSGARVLTQEVANDIFRDQLGQPVSPTKFTQAVQQVNQWYARNSYLLGRVLSLQPTREGVLTIEVAEGFIADVRVQFVNKEGKTVDANGKPVQHRTQLGFARRQIQMQPGQVFREETLKQDLDRLNRLGIFDSVGVGFEGDARRATVIYNLLEAPPRAFNFGGGYNDELGIYGAVSFQDKNFAGLAQQLGATVQIGAKDIQGDLRFNSPYRNTEPGMPGYGFNFSRRGGESRVFDEDIPLANGDSVRERRIGGGANLQYPLGPTWMGSLGVEYTQVSMRDDDGDLQTVDQRGNPLTFSGTGIDDLTSLIFIATRDRRDNLFNPGNGSLLSLSTEQFLPLGRGEILGNRMQVNYAQYIPVQVITPNPDAQHPQVFAFNLQGGTVMGDLPPYNAYTLGGINSVRGYDINQVATGRSYFLVSAEYRMPLYRFMGGAVFMDFGTDLGTGDDVLGKPGPQRDKPGSGFGAGIGLRFNSPLGILRTDFGINDQGESRLQFGFGQRF